MSYKRILQDYTLFVDDASYRGRCQSFDPPELVVETVDYRAGGLDAPIPIDMGLGLGDAVAVFGGLEPDAVTAVGRIGAEVRMVVRSALVSDGDPVATEVQEVRGMATTANLGTKQTGQSAQTTLTVKPTFFQVEVDGRVITKIDIKNKIRVIDGEDQLEAIRAAIGL